ncbi:hypothetical protein Tco_1131616 [Tanacetum coccineum]
MHRTIPNALRLPTLTTDIASKKRRKQVARETSSPRKSLKVTIRQKKQSTTPLPPPTAEAKENIAKVQKKLDEEEIEKMVEGSCDVSWKKTEEYTKI